MRGPTKESEAAASIAIARFERWMESEEGLPVFIWLHLFDAHAPYQPPQELSRRYYDEELDPFAAQRFSLPAGARVPWASKVTDLNYILGLYKSEVTHLDQQIAVLLDHPRVRAATLAFTSPYSIYRHRPLTIWSVYVIFFLTSAWFNLDHSAVRPRLIKPVAVCYTVVTVLAIFTPLGLVYNMGAVTGRFI